MKTKTINIYSFSELSDDAKEKAREWYRAGIDFHSCTGREIVESMHHFANHFNLTIKNYSLGDYGNCFVDFECASLSDDYGDAECCTVVGVRLWKWFINNRYTVANNIYYKFKTERGEKVSKLIDILKTDCPFTGVCFDDHILQPFREFMAKPAGHTENFYELMEQCLSCVVSTYADAIEYEYSDECVDMYLTDSDYEFLQNGELA